MPTVAPSAAIPPNLSEVFAALGDPTRLSIVRRLSDMGPLATVSLVNGTGFSRQGITKHLRVLEHAKLVHADRVARDRIWTLRKERLSEVRSCIDIISAQWDEALVRLRAAVEQ